MARVIGRRTNPFGVLLAVLAVLALLVLAFLVWVYLDPSVARYLPPEFRPYRVPSAALLVAGW
jgi:hypothetical protein